MPKKGNGGGLVDKYNREKKEFLASLAGQQTLLEERREWCPVCQGEIISGNHAEFCATGWNCYHKIFSGPKPHTFQVDSDNNGLCKDCKKYY